MLLSPEARDDLEMAQRRLWAAKRDLLDKISFHLGKLGPDELAAAVDLLVKPQERVCLEKPPRPFIRAIERVMEGVAEPMKIGGILASLKARGWLPEGSKDPRGYVTATMSKGAQTGMFVRVEEGLYKLADGRGDQKPHRKIKVTTAIIWATIPKVVGRNGLVVGKGASGSGCDFRTEGIIRKLPGCRGEQLATPLANLRRWGYIERTTGKWYKVTDFGASRFGMTAQAVKARS